MILFCCFLSIRSLVGFGKRYIVQVKKVILFIAVFCLDRIARYTALQSVRCFFLRRNLPTISCCCFWSALLFQPCSSILPVLFWKTSFISLFWGISTVVLTAFVQPHVMSFVDFLEAKTGMLADLFVIVVMGGDAAITVFNMQKFRAHALVLEQMIQIERLRLKNEAEHIIEERPYFKLASFESKSLAIQNHIEKWHETILHRLDASFNFNERRMLKSFPKMKLLEAPHLDEIREKLLKK